MPSLPTPSDIHPGSPRGGRSPTAAALVVGDELLSGKVREANVEVLARALRELVYGALMY